MMRALFFVVVLGTACAQSITGTHPNIPQTRLDIQGAIDADAKAHSQPSRSVVNINNVTPDRATVFTQVGKDESTRHEESWVKVGGAWKPDAAGGVAGSPSAATAN